MSDILLDTDEVDLVIGGDTHRRPCEIVMRTYPRPRLLFRVSGLEQVARFRTIWGPDTRFSLRIIGAGVDCETFFAGTCDDVIEFSPFTEPVVVGSSARVTSVRFDLVNFPTFMVLYGACASRERDRLDINAEGWRIEIHAARECSHVTAFRSPLYSVTHSCTMRRADGATFQSDAAQQVLSVLQDALSFAAGRWVAAVFVEGLGNTGEALWKLWGTGRLRPDFSAEGTWFDTDHGDALANLVSGLFNLRKIPKRAAAFDIALYWYVRSGTDAGGVDGGLILLQAALERLSWQHLVIDRAMFSRTTFSDLPAHDRVRNLVDECRIPLGVPAGLTSLVFEATRRGWDGPKAVAAARNKLVHPEGLQTLPWYDLWRLARWYVELVLLNMIGFDGEYSNRTVARRHVGMVERVPWA